MQLLSRRVLFLLFWGGFLILYLLKDRIDAFTFSYVPFDSEYIVMEQLSKLLLLLVVFIGILAYNRHHKLVDTQDSLLIISLGLLMYLSESNMIPEELHSFLGITVFGGLFIALARRRHWSAAGLLVLGFLVTTHGVLLDMAEENDRVREALPAAVRVFLFAFDEEVVDTLGQALIFAAVAVRYGTTLAQWADRRRAAALVFLGSAVLLAVGDSFLHYTAQPSALLRGEALALALAGFGGVILANRYLLPAGERIVLGREQHLYAFIYLAFVALPTAYGATGMSPFVVVFGPALAYVLWHLYRPRMEQQEPGRIVTAELADGPEPALAPPR